MLGTFLSKHLRQTRRKSASSLEISLLLSERFHRSLDWILLGKGKWLNQRPGAALPGSYRQGKGVNGNRNQRHYLSTMEKGKEEFGAETLLSIGREFGRSIEWLLTG